MKFEVEAFFIRKIVFHYVMVINAYGMILRKPKGKAALKT